jgi:hypothetical protein
MRTWEKVQLAIMSKRIVEDSACPPIRRKTGEIGWGRLATNAESLRNWSDFGQEFAICALAACYRSVQPPGNEKDDEGNDNKNSLQSAPSGLAAPPNGSRLKLRRAEEGFIP